MEVWQCSEEILKTKFNSMIGLVDRERVDAELYDDYETAKAREVCESYFDPGSVHFLSWLEGYGVVMHFTFHV